MIWGALFRCCSGDAAAAAVFLLGSNLYAETDLF